MASTPPSLTLSGPVDVLAAVPYLIGFHPTRSLVVLGLSGAHPHPHGQARLTLRWDLPLSPDALDGYVPILFNERITHVIAIGYGPGPLVTPAVDRIRSLSHGADIFVAEALRTEGGRYWSYICQATTCCPADGTPYDVATSQIPAMATLHGMVALPDRAALEESVTPLGGAVRKAMRKATRRAMTNMIGRFQSCRDADGLASEVVTDGIARVHAAVEAYRSGGRLSDDDAARLGLALAVIRVRDEAWTSMGADGLRAHLALWHDLVRRAEPRFLPPVASLLALAAWRSGDCALADLALRRALAADPGYSMAVLLSQALNHMLPPDRLDDRIPRPADLDQAMGRPHMSWLLPLLALVDDQGGDAPSMPTAGPAGTTVRAAAPAEATASSDRDPPAPAGRSREREPDVDAP
ncbi:DUF4192 domain-containing protein [Spongiactinospora sp. TRM90649]|uniref:DUF4192 domain-containing protein n=1 Tax=Spongiactinospora sp. TRM90649 TaxID=3031114 RepID=UPI0023F74116|nr:DUF4192 domain-containing protein [Spongiactinospora sp. TRM90649]MDF5755323.1 DUF4192 domain-containing protein [Spongiactinospora sp. TRM90649]